MMAFLIILGLVALVCFIFLPGPAKSHFTNTDNSNPNVFHDPNSAFYGNNTNYSSNVFDDDDSWSTSSSSSIFDDDSPISSISSDDDFVINPASGLPMIGGIGGIDAAGNVYGSYTSDDFNHTDSLSFDDSFSSTDSFNDPYGSGFNHDD